MGAGFQAWTDSGLIQIDGLTPNYHLSQQYQTVTTQASLPTVTNNVGNQFSATYYQATFNFTGTSPLFAFWADGGQWVTPWKFQKTGDLTWQVQFISAYACNIRLFIFDLVPVQATTAGLQVFNDVGVLIADAAFPMARVIDVVDGQYLAGAGYDATGTSMPGPGTLSRDYGKPVAVACAFPAHYLFNTGDGGGGETTMSGWSFSGNQITWEFHTFNGTRGDHYVGYREATYYRFMVLDMIGIL